MKLFAVIDERSVCEATGYLALMGPANVLPIVDHELEIEVVIEPGPKPRFVPVDDELLRKFGEVKPAFINKIRVQH
jgi:hypothetical protein